MVSRLTPCPQRISPPKPRPKGKGTAVPNPQEEWRAEARQSPAPGARGPQSPKKPRKEWRAGARQSLYPRGKGTAVPTPQEEWRAGARQSLHPRGKGTAVPTPQEVWRADALHVQSRVPALPVPVDFSQGRACPPDEKSFPPVRLRPGRPAGRLAAGPPAPLQASTAKPGALAWRSQLCYNTREGHEALVPLHRLNRQLTVGEGRV